LENRASEAEEGSSSTTTAAVHRELVQGLRESLKDTQRCLLDMMREAARQHSQGAPTPSPEADAPDPGAQAAGMEHPPIPLADAQAAMLQTQLAAVQKELQGHLAQRQELERRLEETRAELTVQTSTVHALEARLQARLPETECTARVDVAGQTEATEEATEEACALRREAQGLETAWAKERDALASEVADLRQREVRAELLVLELRSAVAMAETGSEQALVASRQRLDEALADAATAQACQQALALQLQEAEARLAAALAEVQACERAAVDREREQLASSPVPTATVAVECHLLSEANLAACVAERDAGLAELAQLQAAHALLLDSAARDSEQQRRACDAAVAAEAQAQHARASTEAKRQRLEADNRELRDAQARLQAQAQAEAESQARARAECQAAHEAAVLQVCALFLAWLCHGLIQPWPGGWAASSKSGWTMPWRW
jgi:hypothetical protein